MRNANVDGYPYKIVSGAQADQTIKGSSGSIKRIHVWVAGAASSKIEVYDGTVAAGTKIAEMAGTAITVPGDGELDIYCASSINVKTTDSGGNMRITVTFN